MNSDNTGYNYIMGNIHAQHYILLGMQLFIIIFMKQAIVLLKKQGKYI